MNGKSIDDIDDIINLATGKGVTASIKDDIEFNASTGEISTFTCRMTVRRIVIVPLKMALATPRIYREMHIDHDDPRVEQLHEVIQTCGKKLSDYLDKTETDCVFYIKNGDVDITKEVIASFTGERESSFQMFLDQKIGMFKSSMAK